MRNIAHTDARAFFHLDCLLDFGADARPLQIRENPDRRMQFFRKLAYPIDDTLVPGVLAVRKIETHDIHTRLYHFPQSVLGLRRRPDRRDDFCLLHSKCKN